MSADWDRNYHSKHYQRWKSMMARCHQPGSQAFHHYGARGISVCEEWKDFQAFRRWADATYEEGKSIDRINNDGNYEPSNCRWATKSEQTTNRRVTEKMLKHLPKFSSSAAKRAHKIFGDPKTRTEKICSTCKAKKPLGDFNKSRWDADGHGTQCRICATERSRRYRARKNQKEMRA